MLAATLCTCPAPYTYTVYLLTTGYTDGYAYSTLRVMRDRNSEPEWVQCE